MARTELNPGMGWKKSTITIGYDYAAGDGYRGIMRRRLNADSGLIEWFTSHWSDASGDFLNGESHTRWHGQDYHDAVATVTSRTPGLLTSA